MVKDHSDSEKGNPLPPHRLLLSINSKGSFISYMHYPTDRITHTTAFVTPVVCFLKGYSVLQIIAAKYIILLLNIERATLRKGYLFLNIANDAEKILFTNVPNIFRYIKDFKTLGLQIL